MSAPEERGLEIKVGIFVFIGLAFIAVMAVKFGQLGQGFKKFYPLIVELPNASGLIKNSDVQLAGARIGYVADKPRISSSVSSVTVLVNIAEGVKIPRNTRFQVNSSGLLGDKFVEIIPADDFDAAKFDPNDASQTWNPNDTIRGSKTAGLDLEALQKKAETLFDQLGEEAKDLKAVTQKISTGILSDANQKNVSDTLANLKTTTEQFTQTSKNLNTVILNTQGVLDASKKTIGTVDSAAADLRTAIGDARKVFDAARGVMTKAQTGDGLLPTLLNNRELSDNLRALVVNLREHGILFYKNRAAQTNPQTRERPAR
ncbi:MAG: phospholipid/cholesterol/gamma-HCH transport system substrate-binding protein [Chthoniobacter sp.]|jgi:phospholipid/cholesterol/gamma-HCH transport system substrate-binding protein|nr:phospholipid/cholesterol/gamma-HCH transport system substrate-binding protein [Chthoniobacter sp.]